MRVIGLDPSLQASGLATPEQVTTLRPPKGIDGPERLVWIHNEVILGYVHGVLTKGQRADLVVIEGYSHASAYQAHQLGELGGVLRVALWEAEIPFVVIQPDVLKKFATGDGGAGKEQMLAAAIRRLGYDGHDHNAADALWLREAALTHYQIPADVAPKIPKAQVEALYATVRKGKRKGQPVIDWPDLRVPTLSEL